MRGVGLQAVKERPEASAITAYKICYVNFHPWKDVHNSLDLSYRTFKDQTPLPT